MRQFLLIAFFLGVHVGLFAQNTPSEYVDTFFAKYETQGVSEAIDFLFVTNKFMSAKSDQLMKLKNQAETYLSEEVVGKYYGREFIVSRSLGESMVYISYMAKYGRQPFRFEFIFYKPDKSWKIQNFSFDDNLDDELSEAGTIYRLPGTY